MRFEEVADRLEINELLARYCHAVDRKDWQAFRAIFTDDASLDFTAFGGPAGSVGELEAFLIPVLESLTASQHMTSTVMVDLDGDAATARSAAIVPMSRLDEEGQESTVVSGLWYEDQLVRTPGGWRIRARKQVRSWSAAL